MVKLRTVADLRRIPVGTKLRLVACLMGPTDKARVVAKVQTNGIGFKGDGIAEGRVSWLMFPKSSEFEVTDKGFRIYETWERAGHLQKRELAAEYILESDPS